VKSDQEFRLPRTRAEAVADALRTEIMSGTIAAGAPLRQVELAKRFGVSTTPVREAFAALLREGLVVGDSHRGVVVFRPSLDDLHENYEIRIALESLAAAKAAERITEEELTALDDLLAKMRGVHDPIKYFSLNRRFHAAIYQAAGRPRLAALIERLRDAGHAYGNLYAVRSGQDRSQTEAEHGAIFQALKAKAPARSAKAMADHLRRNADFVAGQLTESANGRARTKTGGNDRKPPKKVARRSTAG
jgi:DNA-binding GntR family transcriptional regulator